MQAVVALAADVVRRWGIAPGRVLAHSDVAPQRKNDPGEKFDWQRLATAGVGLWVEPEPLGGVDAFHADGGALADRIRHAQRLLSRFGYQIDETGEADAATCFVVTAFQRHFRPACVDGRLDGSTLVTLERLVAACESQPGPVA